MHGIPAGLPCGMPGIGDEMDGAMQHAPQPGRHSMFGIIVAPVPQRKAAAASGPPAQKPSSPCN